MLPILEAGHRLGDPVCPWPVCIKDSEGENLYDWSARATDLRGVLPTTAGTGHRRVHPP